MKYYYTYDKPQSRGGLPTRIHQLVGAIEYQEKPSDTNQAEEAGLQPP